MEIGPAEVRHAIRGTMNALKLCVAALEMPLQPSEELEFLADVELSADQLASLLDQYEAPPPAPAATPPPFDVATAPPLSALESGR